jgi:crotonobetainyl-CoA:carnitine CoA-transferase CaiB-like acyl-CoA transferase
VLDLTRVRAGPTCVRKQADFGADVIGVEPPPGVDPNEALFASNRRGGDFQNLNRNKRALTLNLKTAEGPAVFTRLAARADVVVENWRPDVKARLGLDYESLAAINPRIVLASISGFGQDGPYAQGSRCRTSPPACTRRSACWWRSPSASAPVAASGCRPRCCTR